MDATSKPVLTGPATLIPTSRSVSQPSDKENVGTVIYPNDDRCGLNQNPRDGTVTIEFSDGREYKGTFFSRKMHDPTGKMTWPGGDSYEGSFVDGRRTGVGKSTGKAGVYEGHFVDGKRHGLGTMTWADGKRYTGFFNDGKRVGIGLEWSPDGTKVKVGEFSGELRRGMEIESKNVSKVQMSDEKISYDIKEGCYRNAHSVVFHQAFGFIGQTKKGIPYGLCCWLKGARYEGEYKNGLPHGKGSYRLENGDQYEGNLNQGRFDGFGVLICQDGKKMEGTFSNACLSEGTITLPNGEIQKGSFNEEFQLIKGEVIYPNGDVYQGDFYNGEGQGKGRMNFSDGSAYVGNFKNGKPYGEGELINQNKTVSRGLFKEGKLTGEALVTKADGTVICSGNFENGLLNGKGQMTHENGKTYQGIFVQGKLHGLCRVISPDGSVEIAYFDHGVKK